MVLVFELVLLLLAIAIPVFLANKYPEATQQWFARFVAARRVIVGTLTIVFAAIFLGSGSPTFMLLGAVMVAIVVLTVLYDEPQKEVLKWLDV